ncbi:MAG: endonuclease, partial [Cyanobacteria bacterium J06648_11]
VSKDHRKKVEDAIGDLAIRLRADERWPAEPGGHCDRCSFSRYCNETCETPEPLPVEGATLPQLQLALSLSC